MDRKSFLALGAFPALAPVWRTDEDSEGRGAVLVFADGRVTPWLNGRIDADSAFAMGVTSVKCADAPVGPDGPRCVWAEPHNDLVGVYRESVWDSADAIAVEGLDGFDAIVTVRAAFRIDMKDGSYILSAGRET